MVLSYVFYAGQLKTQNSKLKTQCGVRRSHGPLPPGGRDSAVYDQPTAGNVEAARSRPGQPLSDIADACRYGVGGARQALQANPHVDTPAPPAGAGGAGRGTTEAEAAAPT